MLYLLHPALIHFPVALLLTHAGLTLVHTVRPDPFVEQQAYWALVAGWWGTVMGIVSGLATAALQWPYAAPTLPWLNLHALTSFALLWTAGKALLLRKRDPQLWATAQRHVYLRWVLLSSVLVIVTGGLGGHLVYDLNVLQLTK